MGIRNVFSSFYCWIFPSKKRLKEYKERVGLLESNLSTARSSARCLEGRLGSAQDQLSSLNQNMAEKERLIQEYKDKINSYEAPNKKQQMEVEKMLKDNVPAIRGNGDLEASVEEAKQAAQYQMQRFTSIKEHGRRGDAKFVVLYSLIKYLETFEGDVRGSIAKDQFQELGEQNNEVVERAQGLNHAAQSQDGQKYIAGVAGLIAKAVDTAGVAIKAEAIKTGDYETYRKEIPNEAIALIHKGIAGVLGTRKPRE